MANKVELLLEAERRGILPEDKAPLLAEARRRGLIPGGETAQPQEQSSLPSPGTPQTTTLEEQGQGYTELEGQPLISGEQAKRMVRPTLETAGAIGGGIVAAPLNIIAPGVSEVLGVAGGYMAGKGLADIYEEGTGLKKPTSPGEALKEKLTTDLPMGLGMGLLGPATSKSIEALGNAAKSVWGALTGTGKAAIEEAVKSGTKTGITSTPFKSATAFDRAMRGEITNQEVAQHAKESLSVLRDTRAANYQSELATLSQNTNPIDIIPMKRAFQRTLKDFVRIDSQGNPVWERSAMGPEGSEGVNKVKAIMDIVEDWGNKPGDNTPLGLDMLKRQLDDFYSDSSAARRLVETFRDKVKELIIRNVPEYKAMMKDYSEATTLIKDIETDLMMRKQGMTGRITADQTLRRLLSAMRDNFPLRKDLVMSLSTQSGQDIMGEVAGMSMNTFIPRGIAGTGPALLGEAAIARFVTPKMWPVLAASSPRLTGEFLRLYGKGLAELKGTSPMVARGITAMATEEQQ